MAEHEKKLRAGDTFVDSVRNVMTAQANSYSSYFGVKKLPGYVRNFQEKPFKLLLACYDQLRLGAEYLNRTENSFLCIDSSGKLWGERQKKDQPKKLNTALVFPPVKKGESPFPIFEQISESNKTIDFVMFLEYAWHFMRDALNNQDVKFPRVIVSDLSFANAHAILHFCVQMKINAYLNSMFHSLVNGETHRFETVLAICENHLLPALLKFARGIIKDKMLADTTIAGMMLMFQASSFNNAVDIWNNLVKIHCSKREDTIAQEVVKSYSYEELKSAEEADLDSIEDFDKDSCDPEEIVRYGKREAIRANSPFYIYFKKVIDKLEASEEAINEINNTFWCPQLLKALCKQYLSLFPLFSACVLPNSMEGLRNNAYVELYWQELRRLLKKIPQRQLWPPQYLGYLHNELQLKAKEIINKKFIPNLRTGGKVRPKKTVSFIEKLDKELFIARNSPTEVSISIQLIDLY